MSMIKCGSPGARRMYTAWPCAPLAVSKQLNRRLFFVVSAIIWAKYPRTLQRPCYHKLSYNTALIVVAVAVAVFVTCSLLLRNPVLGLHKFLH